MSVKGDDGKVRQVALDLVGKEGSKVVLIGECKFRNQWFGKAELDALRTKIDLLPNRAPRIVLFSLSGFTPDVLAEDVLAVDIDAMYERDRGHARLRAWANVLGGCAGRRSRILCL